MLAVAESRCLKHGFDEASACQGQGKRHDVQRKTGQKAACHAEQVMSAQQHAPVRAQHQEEKGGQIQNSHQMIKAERQHKTEEGNVQQLPAFRPQQQQI